MARSRYILAAATIILGLLPSGTTLARSLSFEQRVQVQGAIEEVRHRHRVGTTRTFEEAVPRPALEGKVRRYLRLSAALEAFWNTPVTPDALHREAERMARQTRMPGRLREVYAAVEHDAFVFQECVARAVLVDRLARSFFARDERIHGPVGKVGWDDWWSENRERFRYDSVETVADVTHTLPEPAVGRAEGDGETCPAPDTWDNGSLEAIPTPRARHVTAWTGSEMVAWGGAGRDGTGVRYGPSLDMWSPVNWAGAPAGREYAAGVWTGSALIVWGGMVGSLVFTDDGARYDPVADAWTPISSAGAPLPRDLAEAVWTGTEMIVWGGRGYNVSYGDGGRYDPATDTWTPMSDVGAPSARTSHSAVWTGTEMIVWGGSDNNIEVNTGGRYDPASDTWTATEVQFAPEARWGHTAVWTGEEMIVWGGAGAGHLSTGGRYDPLEDRWRATKAQGAPDGRRSHSAVWTGDRMIVWGGNNGSGFTDTGGAYEPAKNRWTPTSMLNAPAPRAGHSAVWTGSVMVVALGFAVNGISHGDGGGRYDPATDSWTPVDSAKPPVGRRNHGAVWTGSEMVVWGGEHYSADQNTGGLYDPILDSWTATTTIGAPAPRWGHSTVWSGSEMIVWGGAQDSESVYLADGGRYDPVSDSWSLLPIDGAPSPRVRHTTVWAGEEMVVWGGFDGAVYSQTGGRYRPDTNAWSPTTLAGAPSARQVHTAVWTGREMIVWGGSPGASALTNTGALYRPDTDEWRPTSIVGAPEPRMRHSAVWTGERMIVWAGRNWSNHHFDSGGAYDPETDSWFPMGISNAPERRVRHTATWTGSEMFVWAGQWDNTFIQYSTAGRYRLASDAWQETIHAPQSYARNRHTAVWTGDFVLVWGGSDRQSGARYVVDTDSDGTANLCDDDDDGDGVPDAGDCLAADAGVWGTPGEARDLLLSHDRGSDLTTLRWTAPEAGGGAPAAVRYDVLRSSDASDFETADCVDSFSMETESTDSSTPPAGNGFHYLVRARNRCPDGLGRVGVDSSGQQRTGGVCP